MAHLHLVYCVLRMLKGITDASGRMLLGNGIGLVTKYVHVTLHLKASGRILPTQLSFALIHWLEEHQERFNMYPAPIEVWSPPSGVLSFIPVASILSRVAVMKDNNSETLVIYIVDMYLCIDVIITPWDIFVLHSQDGC